MGMGGAWQSESRAVGEDERQIATQKRLAMTDSMQIAAQKKLAMTKLRADLHTLLCVNIFS